MASSLTHKEAQLRKRNEKLEQLWRMDNEIRDWHATSAWKSSEAEQSKMTDRHLLAQELTQMGAAPWDYDPQRDNSWLCVQRQR